LEIMTTRIAPCCRERSGHSSARGGRSKHRGGFDSPRRQTYDAVVGAVAEWQTLRT
jgi:hypothetical protein